MKTRVNILFNNHLVKRDAVRDDLQMFFYIVQKKEINKENICLICGNTYFRASCSGVVNFTCGD